MIRVMAAVQTFNGVIEREVGQFGGDDALQRAEDFRTYWASQPATLLTWLA